MFKGENAIRIIVIVLTILLLSVFASFSSAAATDNVNKTGDKEGTLQFYDNFNKTNITETEAKMSTDLLYLIKANGSQTSSEPFINSNSFQSSNFIPADPAKGVNEDLVYVYVYFNKDSDIEAIEPFVQEITDRDPENSLAVAWVSVNGLEELASLKEVRSIRTVLLPVVNNNSTATGDNANTTDDTEKNNYLEDGNWIKVLGILAFTVITFRLRSK